MNRFWLGLPVGAVVGIMLLTAASYSADLDGGGLQDSHGDQMGSQCFGNQ